MTEIEFATRAFIKTLPHGERERAAKLFLANATEGFNAGFTTAQLTLERKIMDNPVLRETFARETLRQYRQEDTPA